MYTEMSKKPDITLANTRAELKRMNEVLHSRCGPTYKLKIDQYRYRDPDAAVYDEAGGKFDYDIILCLYHGPKCVSSVTGRCNQKNGSMELLSKTASKYEGLKFNLYLRTIFVYLMRFVRPTIKTIYSHSLNPISTYAMYKHYHATNPDLQEYVKTRGLAPDTFTLADAKSFHEIFTEKYKQTEESAREELEAMMEAYEVDDVEELGLGTEEDAIQFIMTTMNVHAITLELNLQAESTGVMLANKLENTHIHCYDMPGATLGRTSKTVRTGKTVQSKKSIRPGVAKIGKTVRRATHLEPTLVGVRRSQRLNFAPNLVSAVRRLQRLNSAK